MIENDAIDNCDLDVYEFKAYAVIVRHANRDTQSAFPSLTTLTRKSRMWKKENSSMYQVIRRKRIYPKGQ